MTVPPTRENTDFGFITVYGTLAAQGTASDSIVFTRMGNTGWWGLIHMTKTANPGGAPIKYCKMEHASFMNTGIGNLVKTIAGLALDSNSITVSNSRFRNNMIGIQCYKSHAAISNNDISLNGAGIICNHSTPTIAGNSISGNGSGIGCSLQSAPAIKSNIISSNPDNGIYALSGSAVTAVSNTIADNGYGLFSQYAGQITIDNSILWGNSMGSVNDTLPAITHSCVAYTSLYPGTGNRNADPRFTGTPGNPYALTWSNFPVKTIQGTMSPCINTGNPNLNGTGGTWLTDPADRDPDMSRHRSLPFTILHSLNLSMPSINIMILDQSKYRFKVL
jgi:hypothetical protein